MTTHGTHTGTTAGTGTTARQRAWTVLMTNGRTYSVMASTPQYAVGAVLELLGDRFPGVAYERVLDEDGNVAM